MKTQSSATYLIASATIVGALVAGFATGPAFAQKASIDTDTFQFRFIYQPSELDSAASAEKLLLRLKREVRDHCGGMQKMSLDQRSLVTECTNQTMRESIGKFGSATLAQAYETRTGG